MNSDAEPDSNSTNGESHSPKVVNEAAPEYRSERITIDTDTRLASTGDTESMWLGRPARRALIESLERSSERVDPLTKIVAYRGVATTSHTRRDAVSGDWTIYAPSRNARPNDYAIQAIQQVATGVKHSDGSSVDPNCPFCHGAEEETPEAVWSAQLGELDQSPADSATTRFARPKVSVTEGEQADWDVRVVPNKFPAVSPIDSSSVAHVDRHNLFAIADVIGAHEVVIESGNHAESVTEFDSSLLYLTLMAFRDRIRHWREVPGINYISIFKNCGPDAGASLRHSHSQVIATSLLPHRIRTQIARCEHHRAQTGCSLGCDLLRAEIEEKVRVIDQTDSLVAFCPFASRFAGMVRITSVAHQPHFDRFTDLTLDQIASFLWRVLSWVEEAFPGKAFNYMLHTCPPGCHQPEAYQWSLDVIPRLNKTAGFEWSSDCMINPTLPEVAAARYREIARQTDPRNVLRGR